MSITLKRVLVLVVLILLLAPYIQAVAFTEARQTIRVSNTYLHPLFYDAKFWSHGVLSVNPALEPLFTLARDYVRFIGGKIVEPREPYARAIILLPRDVSANDIKALTSIARVTGVYPTHSYTVVTAWVTPSSVEHIKTLGFVSAVLPDTTINIHAERESRSASSLEEVLKQGRIAGVEEVLEAGNSGEPVLAQASSMVAVEPATAVSGSGFGLYHYTVNLTGAVDVWVKYGVYGENVTIAVIDTGVDYASPGLGLDAIARDEYGLPLVLDADSVGLVLTPLEAKPVSASVPLVRINPSRLYYFIPPYYVVKSPNGFAYVAGCWLTYPIPAVWSVPPDVVKSALEPRFGLAVRILNVPRLGVIAFTVPVIVYSRSGFYDTILLDLTTTYYYLYKAANMCGVEKYLPAQPTQAPDYSFADEKPVTYGSELAALDLDGDGVYDFSVGTLAGYVNDASGAIILQVLGRLARVMENMPVGYGVQLGLLWDAWSFESLGYIWPGLDVWTGQYFDLEYDFYGHGTFCATTAAGRPVPGYTGYGPYNGWSLIPGQAPRAKIAASSSLFVGNILTAIYFFSGFDQVTPYGEHVITPVPFKTVNPWTAFSGGTWSWRYTGRHQVDLTSNSYGASGWALWGWASGLDPLSIVFDYTTAVSNTLHFVAAGNGGPGWGTVTPPAASTLAVSVGAATEFTYRTLYGYLPGGNRQIVSWSNRGPAESLFAKPDIIGIGSFAFATGRPWDSLVWGRLTGVLAFDLFGGTSQATPMVAGVAALVASTYKAAHGSRIPAPLLKTILMNSAEPMGYNTLSQGAGFVDAFKAVEKLVNNSTLVYNAKFMQAYKALIGDDAETFTYGSSITGLAWYEPKIVLAPDLGLDSQQLIIKGRGVYKLTPVTLSLKQEYQLCDAPGALVATDCVDGGVAINLGAIGATGSIILAVIEPTPYYDYDIVEISMAYPFQFFNTSGRYTNYTRGIYYNGLELWAWIDLNNDGAVQLNETARIQYDLRGANAFHIQVARLREELAEIVRLATLYTGLNATLYPVRLLLVYRVVGNEWSGTNVQAYASIVVRGYAFESWRQVEVAPSHITVDGEATVVVRVADDSVKGVSEGYIVVEDTGSGEEILVPVTLVKAYKISSKEQLQVPENGVEEVVELEKESLYKNYMLRGAFDYTWRYESGDWRVIPVLVASPTVKYILVEARWPTPDKNYASNLDIMVFGPYTYYMAYLDAKPVRDTNGEPLYPVAMLRVHGLQLGAELTYPQQYFFDEPEPGYSRIIVPVSGPGLYRLVVRNIQFSGMLGDEEPFEIVITPVVVRTSPIQVYLAPSKTANVTLVAYLKAGLGNTSFSIEFVDEFIKSIDGNLYYGNTSKYFNSTVEVTGYTSTENETTVTARIQLEALPTATPGNYTLYYTLSSPGLPVTSVGYMVHGEKYYQFYWNKLPVELTVIVK